MKPIPYFICLFFLMIAFQVSGLSYNGFTKNTALYIQTTQSNASCLKMEKRIISKLNETYSFNIISKDLMQNILNKQNNEKNRSQQPYDFNHVIYAELIRHETKHEKPLGESGKNKYLIKIEHQEFFELKMKLMDIKNNSVLIDSEVKGKQNKIDQNISDFMGKAKPYLGYEIKLEKKVRKTPLLINAREQQKKFNHQIWATPTVIFPQGNFKDVTSGGFGISIFYEFGKFPGKGFSSVISASYYEMDNNNNNIKNYSLTSMLLSLGYDVKLADNLTLFPFAGIGYLKHFIQENTDNNQSYGDFYFAANCKIEYSLSEKYSVFAISGYNVFFEQGYLGQFINTNLGAKIVF